MSDSSFREVYSYIYGFDRSTSDERKIIISKSLRWSLRLASFLLRRNSPKTFALRSKLAEVLADQGDFAGAEAEYRIVLDGQSRVLSANHPDTLTTRNRLASVSAEQGDLKQAQIEYRAVLDAQAQVLGPEHPSTLATRSTLQTSRFGKATSSRQSPSTTVMS